MAKIDASRSSTSRRSCSSMIVGLMLCTGFKDACYEHISLVKSEEDNQWIQLKRMLIKGSVPTTNTLRHFRHFKLIRSIKLLLQSKVQNTITANILAVQEVAELVSACSTSNSTMRCKIRFRHRYHKSQYCNTCEKHVKFQFIKMPRNRFCFQNVYQMFPIFSQSFRNSLDLGFDGEWW